MSALLSPEDLKRQALANVQDATESNAENPALTALRDSSLAALKAAVFPGRKTEQWKYTSLQPLADGHLNRRARPPPPRRICPSWVTTAWCWSTAAWTKAPAPCPTASPSSGKRPGWRA